MSEAGDSNADVLTDKAKELKAKKENSKKVKITEKPLQSEEERRENLYLKKVFPIFLFFVGVFIIAVNLFTVKTNLVLYIGIGVIALSLIWALIAFNL